MNPLCPFFSPCVERWGSFMESSRKPDRGERRQEEDVLSQQTSHWIYRVYYIWVYYIWVYEFTDGDAGVTGHEDGRFRFISCAADGTQSVRGFPYHQLDTQMFVRLLWGWSRCSLYNCWCWQLHTCISYDDRSKSFILFEMEYNYFISRMWQRQERNTDGSLPVRETFPTKWQKQKKTLKFLH